MNDLYDNAQRLFNRWLAISDNCGERHPDAVQAYLEYQHALSMAVYRDQQEG